MYSTVPQKLYVFPVEPIDSLLRPKSVTFTCPSSSRRTLQSDDLHTHKPKDASLFRLEISISDAQRVQMAECENELGKIEFDVVFCEHNLLSETSEKVAAAQKFEYKIKFAIGLKRCNFQYLRKQILCITPLTIVQFNDKWMLYLDKNIALEFCPYTLTN